jgi:hypothetical protein
MRIVVDEIEGTVVTLRLCRGLNDGQDLTMKVSNNAHQCVIQQYEAHLLCFVHH